MEHMEEKVAAHEATLGQMNERLGSIDTRLAAIEARMTTMATTLATKGELRWWAGLISGLITIAVGAILKFG